MAGQMCPHDYDEALAVAKLALVEAARRFDPERRLDNEQRIQFTTYATYWIRALLFKHVIDLRQGQVRYITRHDDRKVFFNLARTLRKFPDPDAVSDAVVAEHMGVSEDAVTVARGRDKWRDVAIDAPISDTYGSETFARWYLRDDSVEHPDEALTLEQDRARLARAIKQADLNVREMKLVRWRLLAEEPRTLQEIADKWGVSRERVRQIEVRTLRLIQQELRSSVRRRRSRPAR